MRKDSAKDVGGKSVIVKGKTFKAPASWNAEKRTARFTMTSEAVDRYGDIVVQSGMDITRFMENPQGLVFHNSRSWPIGNWSDITKNLTGRPKRTEGTLNFLPEGVEPDADRAARHVAAGSIKTVSIGFSPDWDAVELILDDDEEWVTGLKFNKSELLECSLVPIPAQPDALVKDAGGDWGLAKELIEEVLDTWAKTPEGILIPLADYEREYKYTVEKIHADTITAAGTADVTTDTVVLEVDEIKEITVPANGDDIGLAKLTDAEVEELDAELLAGLEALGDDLERAVEEAAAEGDGELSADEVREAADPLPKSNNISVEVELDTTAATEKLTTLQKLVESVTDAIARIFGKSAPAEPAVEKAADILSPVPSAEEIAAVKALLAETLKRAA